MSAIYWSSTALISVMLLLSAFAFFFHKGTIDGFRTLGLLHFFRIELAVLKIIAVFLLLSPAIPVQLKEWAYAGTGLFLIPASVTHITSKNSIGISLTLLVFIGLLATSTICLHNIMV